MVRASPIDHSATGGLQLAESMAQNSSTFSPMNVENRSNHILLDDHFHKFDDMSWGRVTLVLLSLGLVCFLYGMEQTVVATSAAGIGSSLGANGSLTWITMSYLLTTTVLQPITGRVADAVGTTRTLIIELWIFILGNVIAGASKTLTQLVIGRLIGGIGGAGLLSLSIIALSQLTHERQRGSYLNFMNVVFTLSDSLGPIVGGLFSKSGNWRWIFFYNAPFGPVITLILLKVLRIPHLPSHSNGFRDNLRKVDFIGMTILVTSLTLLVVGLNLGGRGFAWNSSTVIGLFCGAGVSFVAFVVAENFTEFPVVPTCLFVRWQWRNVPIITVARCLLYSHFYSLIFYLPVFLQVIGTNALGSAALVIPFLSMGALSSTITNHVASKYGHVRPLFLSSLAILAVGMGLMSTLNEKSSLGFVAGYSLICGVGYGSGSQISVVIGQVGLPADFLSTVTALLSSTSNLGGVLGIGILGAIIDSVFRHALARSVPSTIGTNLNDVVSLVNNGPFPRDLVVEAYVSAWRQALWVLAGIAVFQFLLCLILRPLEFRDGTDSEPPAAVPCVDEKHRERKV